MRPRPALGPISACLLGLLAACGAEGSERPSVLLITLDTTRADRLGCYGYPDAGTPALDALAARGARFDQARTPAPITLPAHAAILTGAGPRTTGVRDNGQFVVDERLTTLAEHLGERGWRTGAVIGAYPLFEEFGLGQGFEYYDDAFGSADQLHTAEGNQRRGGEVAASAVAWLGSVGDDEAFFLWAHFFDPHWPYDPPAEQAARFPGDPYQGEIAYADSCVGEILAALEEDGRLASTVVAVVADHGEALGEHGEESHTMLVYDSTMRVPLILAGPGVAEGASVGESVSVMDLAPTLAELLDVPSPPDARGASLAGLWRGDDDGDRPSYVESHYLRLHHGWSPLEGVAHGDWKLISAPGCGLERDQLFDVSGDPAELVDRAADHPAELRAMREHLEAWRRAAEPSVPFDARRSLTEEDAAALAELGYAGAVDGPVSDSGASGHHPEDRLEVAELTSMANGLIQQRRLEEARPLLDRLWELEPEGVSWPFLTGMYWNAVGPSQIGAMDRAVEAFDRAVALAPDRTAVWRHFGRARLLRGEVREGLLCLRTACRLSPALGGVRREYERELDEAEDEARVLVAKGERERAARLYELLLEERSGREDLRAELEALGER